MVFQLITGVMIFCSSRPYTGVVCKVTSPNTLTVEIDGRERRVRIAGVDFWLKREYYLHSLKGVRRTLAEGDEIEIYYDLKTPKSVIPHVSIWKNGIDINRFLVKHGYLYFMPEIWYFQAYTLEEDYARNHLLGVWRLIEEDKTTICKCEGE